MADPIIQVLGFDVKKALSDLDTLDKRLGTLNQSFSSLSKGLADFNKSGGQATLTFAKMAKEASKAEKQITKLIGAQERQSDSRRSERQQQADAIADQLRNRFTLPQGSTQLQERAFESAIRRTADLAASADKNVDDVQRIMGGLRNAFDTTENRIADSVARIEKSFQSISNAAERNTGRATRELDRLVKEANRDEIAKGLRRQFNIPADASVAELRAFENAIEKAAATAAKAGKTVRDVPQIFKNLGKGFQGADNELANSLSKVQNAFQRLGSSARKEMALLEKNAINNITRITVSFDTFVRIISTQLIIKGLNRIQQGFLDAGKAASTFEKSVARIKTLADDELGGIGAIGNQLRGLSDTFGLDLQTVAEGAFTRISNQVGDARQSLESLNQVAKFSIATGTELADGVGLVDSVINASGKTIEDTGDILGKFFKVIDLGRVDADQLRDTLGRVLPVGEELGVTYEEIGSALAEITIQGVTTNEAFTQIRGILNALQKPTDSMKAALLELGFEESETAVRTLGLAEVLSQLEATTNGSATAFAKMFPNVRGLTGATILARDNAEGLRRTLDKVNQSGADFLDEKFQIVFETNAVQVEKQVNKLRNALINDLGNSLVATTAAFFRMTGGADTLLSAISGGLPIMLGMGAALLTIGTRAGLAQAGIISLADATGKATRAFALFQNTAKFLAVAGLAAGIGTTIGNLIGEAIFEGGEEGLKRLEDEFEQRQKDLQKDLNDANLIGEIITDSARRRLQQFTKDTRDEFEQIGKDSDRVTKRIAKGLDAIVSHRQRLVSELKKAAQEATDAILDSQDRAEEIQRKQQQRLFDRKLQRRTPEQQAFEVTRQAETLGRQAGVALQNALKTGSDRDLKKALSAFDRAEQAAERAESIAATTETRADDVRAQRTLDELARKRLAAERQIQDSKTKQRKLDEEAAGFAEEGAKAVEDQVASIKEDLKAFSEGPASERADRLDDLRKGFERLRDLGIGDKGLDLLRQIGLKDFLKDAQDELGKTPLELKFEVAEADLENIDKRLRAHFNKLKVALPGLSELQEATGQTISSTAEAQNALSQVDQAGKNDRRIAGEIQATSNIIADTIAKIRELDSEGTRVTSIDDARRIAGRREVPGQGVFDALTPSNREGVTAAAQAFANYRAELQKALDTGDFTASRLESLTTAGQAAINQLDSIGTAAQTLFFGFQNNNQAFVKSTQEAFKRLVSDQEQILDKSRQLRPEAQSRQRFLNQTPLDQQGQKLLQDAQATDRALQGGGTALEQSGRQLRLDAEAAARALIQTRPGGRPPGFATGGFSRGTDTQLAALSPGEAVINPKSTQAFFSQLQAINAGQKPVFNQAGSVTNVGDINVNVTSSQQSVNPREIAEAVRRELRRKTSKL